MKKAATNRLLPITYPILTYPILTYPILGCQTVSLLATKKTPGEQSPSRYGYDLLSNDTMLRHRAHRVTNRTALCTDRQRRLAAYRSR